MFGASDQKLLKELRKRKNRTPRVEERGTNAGNQISEEKERESQTRRVPEEWGSDGVRPRGRMAIYTSDPLKTPYKGVSGPGGGESRSGGGYLPKTEARDNP